MAQTLLGKEVTAALNERIKADVEKLKAAGVNPTLGIIRVGERGDDISYERGAMKRCDTLGVAVKQYLLPADVTQEQLIATIEEVNKDDSIHGVLMFRPQEPAGAVGAPGDAAFPRRHGGGQRLPPVLRF